jgi:type IV pilus assembly protein PilE
MRKLKGFTLIEVMIVVAIVAILSAIAIPSYTEYIQRSRITDATSALSSMRLKMEQFFQDNRTYAGACAPGTVATLPGTTSNFSFGCTLAANNYAVTATGVGAMAAFGYRITVSNAGVVRSTTALPAGWNTTNSAICWVLKRDGSC